MVFWPMISTLAGISCAVRPSRLALPATTLLLSGVGAGSVSGSGTGFAAVLRAARLARFGARLLIAALTRRGLRLWRRHHDRTDRR